MVQHINNKSDLEKVYIPQTLYSDLWTVARALTNDIKAAVMGK